MPGFFRSCYMTLRRYHCERRENRDKKSNNIEVEEIHNDQTNTKKEPQVDKPEKLNLKKYLHLKLQLIRNLDNLATIDEQKCVRKLDLREMFIQEIDLLTRILKE